MWTTNGHVIARYQCGIDNQKETKTHWKPSNEANGTFVAYLVRACCLWTHLVWNWIRWLMTCLRHTHYCCCPPRTILPMNVASRRCYNSRRADSRYYSGHADTRPRSTVYCRPARWLPIGPHTNWRCSNCLVTCDRSGDNQLCGRQWLADNQFIRA